MQLCPWCHTEVGETEVEENLCPHCLNVLEDYRTLDVELEEPEEIFEYEENVKKRLNEQEESPECPQCREWMLYAGDRRIGGSEFRPADPREPVLEAPFVLKVYVCPSCYQVQQLLAEDDRTRMIRALKK